MNTAVFAFSLVNLSPYAAAVTAGYLIADATVTKIPQHAKKVQKAAIVIGFTAAGAAIGTAVPVIGTAIGAGAGLVVGALVAIFT